MLRFFLAAFLLLFSNSFSQTISQRYAALISADSIRASLFILASDSMEGRETGKRGQKIAAKFLSERYQSWNLLPAGNKIGIATDSVLNRFLQDHPISVRNNKEMNLVINSEKFLYGKDFIYFNPPTDTTITLSNVVFTNNLDLKSLNKILECKVENMCFVFAGNSNDFYAPIQSTIKKLNCRVPVFIITTDTIIKDIFSGRLTCNDHSCQVLLISERVGKKLIPAGRFQSLIQRHRKTTKIFPDSVSVSMSSNPESLRGENVAAFIKGEPGDETVVISSHYDHLGRTDSLIFYGADDNASGTSAVLELARVFMLADKSGDRPERNILFLNFSGEEKGLVGSSYFVSNPTMPMEQFVADLNIDMVGRIDSPYSSLNEKQYIYIIGSDKLSTELHNINEEQNKSGPALKLDYKFNAPDDPNHFYTRSDHYNFAKHGIPVIFYFDGKHADYHKPTDTPDKIDYDLLAKRTSLVFLTAWELANRQNRPYIDKKPETGK